MILWFCSRSWCRLPSNDFVGGDKKWADFIDSEVASVSNASSRLVTNSLASQNSANAVTGNYSQVVDSYQMAADDLSATQDIIESIARFQSVNWSTGVGQSILPNQSFTIAEVSSECKTGTLEIGYCLNWDASAPVNSLHFRVIVNGLEVLDYPNGSDPYISKLLNGSLRVRALSNNSISFLATGDSSISGYYYGLITGLYAYVRSVY